MIAELADLIKEANGIAKRFYEGSPDFPKPEEIARLGKPANLLPGESRNLTWPGKRVFTEPKGVVSWQGVKMIEEEQRREPLKSRPRVGRGLKKTGEI
ncbi:hypothetical protein ACIBQ0_19570 [Nocardia nova]|uniref:hypothetical protein n=1 Tax=Nocardia nova TaxID=37330 RepID=UPI0037BC715D